MGIPLLRSRFLNEHDREDSEPVVVLTKTWPGMPLAAERMPWASACGFEVSALRPFRLLVWLAMCGIYGVLAYLTGQRVPEIGLRMALGASVGNIMRLVLRQSLEMIFVGVGVGILAALAAGRVLQRSVQGMQPVSAVDFAIMIPLLLAAALLASFVPARRASLVNPVQALRRE